MTPSQGIINPALPGSWQGLSGSAFLGWFIPAFISLFITIAFIAAIFYLIYGGIMWITSGGDAKRTEAAGKQIRNAIVGLTLVGTGWAIIKLIGSILGVNILGGGFKLPTL